MEPLLNISRKSTSKFDPQASALVPILVKAFLLHLSVALAAEPSHCLLPPKIPQMEIIEKLDHLPQVRPLQ